ncbi:MAG TPA: four-carbon acid sugar kinase family protein [Propionibacteriaceae bacterium]|nr:four-carbon acid sugar kinase family protein [Propionibacteriaceae bacterium]
MTRPTAPRVLGLVADDLTGAADSAVAFADHGWRVILHLHPERLQQQPAVTDDDDVQTVLAVTTGCRASPDEEAAAVTARAVELVRGAGAQRLYLKIDSTVRGSVAGQISGAQHAWSDPGGPARAIICPAFPSQGRTVTNGRVQVHGVPLEQTAAATDPITPRHTGDLRVIIPGAVSAHPTGQQPLVIVDAADDHDLDALAGQLTATPHSTITVGSGGLAAAVARRWSPTTPVQTAASAVGTGRVLVAVSSLHPVTAGQVSRLRSSSDTGPVDVLISGTATTTADEAAADLAARVDAALAEHPYSALVIVGGDGAAAILGRVGADHLLIDGAIHPGCPSGIVIGGRADGLRLVTKSGGFGDSDTLRTILTRLRRGSDPIPHHRPDHARPTTTKESS